MAKKVTRSVWVPAVAGISLAVLTGGLAVPAQGAPNFRSCSALNAQYPSGVAASAKAARAAVAAGFQRPTVNGKLYNALIEARPRLDRGKNGVACEVVAPVVPSPSPTEPTPSATPSATPSPTVSVTPSPSVTPSAPATPAPSEASPAPTSSPSPDLGGAEELRTTYNVSSGIKARLQWNSNYGYCGETSFITALMRNGAYTSQWTARSFALGGGEQWQEGSQIIIGENGNGVTDRQVAESLRLEVEDYDWNAETNTNGFLSWIKQKFLAGDTVIIGVYNNVPMLGESGDGDPVYDHIVPVVGIGSDHPLDGPDPVSGDPAWTYYNSDIITISDNGLYTPVTNNVPSNSPENANESALYTFNFYDWQNTRAGANTTSSDTSTYDLYSAPIFGPGVKNFGTAVTGIVDRTTDGRPAIGVELTSSVNNEGFHNAAELRVEPAGTHMTLTATANPTPGVEYNVYIYDNFADVPDGNFYTEAVGSGRTPDYVIPTTNTGTWTVALPILTSDTRIFRIVPVIPSLS